MRKLILVGVLMMAFASPAPAAPLCAVGTLDDYIALGEAGCQIGSATFFDFAPSLVYPDADPIASADVTIRPSGIGLEFNVTQVALPGDLYDLLIAFSISGAMLSANLLSLDGASATEDANITGIQDMCVGGLFDGSDPTASCPGSVETSIVVQDAFETVSPDEKQFASTALFGMFLQITVDGGLAGSAEFDGSVTTVFEAAAVPEPDTLLLVGLGLAVVWCVRRHSLLA